MKVLALRGFGYGKWLWMLGLALCAVPLWAEGPTVTGTLVDPDGAPIAGGEVEIGIWQQTGPTGDVIRIDVSDSGEGIDQDAVAVIFDAGYTTKDTRSHEGLGLALVAEVVESYGGSIAVDTEAGSGTLFSVTVPMARELEHV